MSVPTPEHFRNVAGLFATGVTVVTSCEGDGAPCGLTANSFTSVSLDPPLVLVCLDRGSNSHDCILGAGVFAVNILDAESGDIADRFWRMDREMRFRDLDWRAEVTGSPVLGRALGWFDCEVDATHPAGDHTIILGRVVGAGVHGEGDPLLFHSGIFRRGFR